MLKLLHHKKSAACVISIIIQYPWACYSLAVEVVHLNKSAPAQCRQADVNQHLHKVFQENKLRLK